MQHSVYLAAFWPQKGQSAIEMVGGELPGWMAARDDGTVAVSSDLEVVRQTLCADVDAERFAKEVYPRYVVASLSSAATPSTAPLPQHPTTYIICERDQASAIVHWLGQVPVREVHAPPGAGRVGLGGELIPSCRSCDNLVPPGGTSSVIWKPAALSSPASR